MSDRLISEQPQLIVGLGNPGQQYAHTRHNAGADFVAELVHRLHGAFTLNTKFHGLYAKVRLADQDLHCLIPTTYMNRSGQAIAAVANYYKIPATSILVAHDELDIEPGRVRLKKDGGAGGHNGLKDTINHLGTKDFMRLRIGIGHPGHSSEVINYVLKTASNQDQALINAAIDEAVRLLPEVLHGNWNRAQTLMNGFKAE